MASENIIARFESKMDAQNRIIESKMDAVNSKYKTLIIVISIIGAAMTIIIGKMTLTNLIGFYPECCAYHDVHVAVA